MRWLCAAVLVPPAAVLAALVPFVALLALR